MPGTTAPNSRGPSPSSPRPVSPAQVAHRRPARSRYAARYSRLIPDLRPGERVVLWQRRHVSVLFTKLFWPLLLLLIWLVSFPLVLSFLGSLQTDPLVALDGGPPPWLPFVLYMAWLGVAFVSVLWAAYLVLDWMDDWIALTNWRLILMEKKLFFHESRREAPIQKVQNVTAEFLNPLGLSLDFGDLKVDTPGVGVLEFKELPQPKRMREAIFAQQDDLRGHEPPPEDRRKAAIRDILQGKDPSQEKKASSRATGLPVRPSSGQAAGKLGLLDHYFPVSPHRDEQSVTWHKHWIFLLRGLIWPLLAYAAVLSGWTLSALLGEPGVVGPIESVFALSALFLAPVCLIWALWNWEDWRNDIYRLDHERVYDIESLSFGLREESKETLVTRITDVMYVVPGPLANLLDYGNVVIKTPGEATEFVFRGVPCPRGVQQEIMERVDQYRLKASANADHEIEAWLKAYHDVMREP